MSTSGSGRGTSRSTGSVTTWGILGLLLSLLLALTLACTSTTVTPASLITAPALTSPVLRPTVEQAQTEAYVDAVRAERQRQELQLTLDVAYGQQTATAAAVHAAATEQAHQNAATVVAAQATATAQAWQVTVVAAQAHETATAQAATTATLQAQMAQQATATADAARFAMEMSATVEASAATRTAIEAQQQTEAAINTERMEQARQKTQRNRLINGALAVAFTIMLGVSITGIVILGPRLIRALEMRIRAIPRDARGDAPVLVLEQKGRVVAFDPDRAFGPATVLGDKVSQPQLVAPELQERVTARDQAVDLAHRGLPVEQRRTGRKPISRSRIAQLAHQTGEGSGTIRVVPPEAVRAYLRDVRPQALHHALTINAEEIRKDG
ncbi:MAG: hypothetical protein JXA14_02000 [Anaerolineae bacterium]|nr:hypothetical protein [Anaerolineae bacterium]